MGALLDSYGFEGTYDDAENGKRLRSLWNLQQVFPAVHSTQPTKAITVGFAVIQGEENVRALLDKNNPPTFYRAVQPARTTSSSWMGLKQQETQIRGGLLPLRITVGKVYKVNLLYRKRTDSIFGENLKYVWLRFGSITVCLPSSY